MGHRKLSIMHLLSCLPGGDLTTKITQIQGEMRLKFFRLLNKHFEVCFMARRSTAQEMGIRVEPNP